MPVRMQAGLWRCAVRTRQLAPPHFTNHFLQTGQFRFGFPWLHTGGSGNDGWCVEGDRLSSGWHRRPTQRPAGLAPRPGRQTHLQWRTACPVHVRRLVTCATKRGTWWPFKVEAGRAGRSHQGMMLYTVNDTLVMTLNRRCARSGTITAPAPVDVQAGPPAASHRPVHLLVWCPATPQGCLLGEQYAQAKLVSQLGDNWEMPCSQYYELHFKINQSHQTPP